MRIWFMHGYPDFDGAKAKWEERSSRVHWDNIYFIMTDGTGCTEELAQEFDALPWKHKALLTYRDHKNLKSAVKFNIKDIAEYGLGAREVFVFKPAPSPKRVIDDWDYISFLNSRE